MGTTPSSSSDLDVLVARARRGDEDAFAALHRALTPRLRAAAARTVRGSAVDPDDVVQETWIRAHAALPATSADLDVAPWLLTIVRRCAVDALRVQRRPAGADELLAELPAGDGVEERVVRREHLRAVVEDVRALEARQRAVLVAHAVDGRSHAALAGEHGTSEQAMKSLLLRARRNLARRADARALPCGEVQASLSGAAARGVRPSELVRLHLQSCGGCRRERAALRGGGRLAGLLGWLPGLKLKVAAAGAAGAAVVGTPLLLDVSREEWVEPAASPAQPAWRLSKGHAFARYAVTLREVGADGRVPLTVRCPDGYVLWQFDEGAGRGRVRLDHAATERWLGRGETTLRLRPSAAPPVRLQVWAACLTPARLLGSIGDPRLRAVVARNVRTR